MIEMEVLEIKEIIGRLRDIGSLIVALQQDMQTCTIIGEINRPVTPVEKVRKKRTKKVKEVVITASPVEVKKEVEAGFEATVPTRREIQQFEDEEKGKKKSIRKIRSNKGIKVPATLPKDVITDLPVSTLTSPPESFWNERDEV